MINKNYFSKEARAARKEEQARIDAEIDEHNTKVLKTIGGVFVTCVATVAGLAAYAMKGRRSES